MTRRKTTKIDMHVHTKGSDGWGSPESIVRYAKRARLDGLCLTDHHLTYTSESLEVARALRQAGLLAFHGCEYSTAWGHLLVYGVNVEEFKWGYYPSPKRVIRDVNAAGGLCVPAHPYKGYRRFYGDRVKLLTGAVGLETANGRCAFQNPLVNRQAALIAKEHCMGTFGGSDAHSPMHIGLCYTQFDVVIRTEADLLAAMRVNGEFKAVTARKLVQEAMGHERRAASLRRRAGKGLVLDRYPEIMQVSGDGNRTRKRRSFTRSHKDSDPTIH